METMSIIYWCRVGLGVAAAVICVAGWMLTNELFESIIQGVSLAIIFYIITYYILKMKFIAKVEKTSQLFKQGIGAYFLTWIISWTLILSLVLSSSIPTAFFTYSPSSPKVGEIVTFNATAGYASYSWVFGDNTGSTTSAITINHTYTASGNYAVLLYVTDSHGLISQPYSRSVVVNA